MLRLAVDPLKVHTSHFQKLTTASSILRVLWQGCILETQSVNLTAEIETVIHLSAYMGPSEQVV